MKPSSWVKCSTIMVLIRDHHPTIREMAKAIGFSYSYTNYLLRNLREEGYVELKGKRSRAWTLTDKGKQAVRHLMVEYTPPDPGYAASRQIYLTQKGIDYLKKEQP